MFWGGELHLSNFEITLAENDNSKKYERFGRNWRKMCIGTYYMEVTINNVSGNKDRLGTEFEST